MSLRHAILALLAIGLYATLAIHVARAGRSAQNGDASVGAQAWVLGPSGDALETAAVARIDRAVAHLRAAGPGASGWYEAYRAELIDAHGLLSRSLRARPGEPRALARLAAVSWELEGPAAGGTGERAERMIALAASAAPGSAPVQILLGELLLRMARGDDAAERLRQAVALDPTLAVRAVRAYRAHAYDPSVILDVLGSSAPVLLALQPAFLAAGDPTDYLAALEAALPHSGAALIGAYAETCLKLKLADRLLATLNALAPLAAARDEAERLCARSRARLARSEPALALDDAKSARSLAPEDPRLIEHQGHAALAARDPAGAREAFQDALERAARQGASAAVRARLYRMIGVAEDRAGKPAAAYDAYRKTLQLDPADAHATRRIAEMRKAAGFTTP